MIAMLGLGIMGSAFAHDAARSGLATIGWDRDPIHAASLKGDRLRAATNAADAAGAADVVVTMVADADAVMSVMEEHGAFAALRPGSSWIQMATIGVEGTARALRLASTRPEIAFFDAPVSGSRGPAEQGKLVVLASGDRERSAGEVQRFFDAIARQVFWLGEAGQGTRVKLVLNAWMGIIMQGVAEVATLADTLCVDMSQLTEVAADSPLFPPWALQKLQKIVDNRVREPEFPLRWAEKDVLLALSSAGEARSALPILSDVGTVWAGAVEEFGSFDVSAVYLALQRKRKSQ
jgi:3-hydroxyisobutyrate dehydrogenase